MLDGALALQNKLDSLVTHARVQLVLEVLHLATFILVVSQGEINDQISVLRS